MVDSFVLDASGKFLLLNQLLFGGPIGVSLPVAIGKIVSLWFWGATAAVFGILIIYATVKWISGADNAETVTASRKIITTALVGFFVTSLSYIIVAVVLRYLGAILKN